MKYTILNADEYFPVSDPRRGDPNNDFTLRTNSARVDTKGIEAYIKYQPDSHWLVNFQYSNSNHKGSWIRQIEVAKAEIDVRQ